MSEIKEITATYTRTKGMMREYIRTFEERKKTGKNRNPFLEAQSNFHGVIKEFNYWLLLENDFPYDAIATMNHMIIPKRSFPFDCKLLNKEELNEFQELREGYIKDNYDVIYENLPSGQTIPASFHIHLLKLKRTSMKEFMDS